MNARNQHTEISTHECRAMRELYQGDYTHSELAFLFECKDETVANHVNKECNHGPNSLHENVEALQRYTKQDLLTAFRLVYEEQPYDTMSQVVYEDHRPERFPAQITIQRRFGSWPEARRLAHNG